MRLRRGAAIARAATVVAVVVLGATPPFAQASNPVASRSQPAIAMMEIERPESAALPVRSLHHIELIEALRARLPSQGESTAPDVMPGVTPDAAPDASRQDAPRMADAPSACS